MKVAPEGPIVVNGERSQKVGTITQMQFRGPQNKRSSIHVETLDGQLKNSGKDPLRGEGKQEKSITPANSNVPSYQGTGALTMFSHKVRRSIRTSTLLRENTGAVGPFEYRERRQTNSSARIRNCMAYSTSGRSKSVGVVSAVVPVPNAYFEIHLFWTIKASE